MATSDLASWRALRDYLRCDVLRLPSAVRPRDMGFRVDLFSAPAEAYNTACHGNCCVYFASKVAGGKPDKEQTRQDAMSLFGCVDMSSNKVNVLLFTEQAYGVCISNENGCGDCFDDKDFSGGCANC
ncbi:hypothetical protein DFH09DRAFT_1399900 [Mycena vulgaris]|nr:hypothetical protein DFH09DRAFT_1399900 [Mycena vulgaris]